MNEFTKFSEICMIKKSITDASQCGICNIAEKSPINPGVRVNLTEMPKRYAVYYMQGLVGKNPLDRTKPCMR